MVLPDDGAADVVGDDELADGDPELLQAAISVSEATAAPTQAARNRVDKGKFSLTSAR
jgi:hypothetical protein